MSKRRLIIEGGSIAERNMSGVGHTTLNLIKALTSNREFINLYDIEVVVPFNRVQIVKRYNFPDSVTVRKMYIPGKIMNGLVRLNLVPYMDIFFGRGVYLFPNFKNWPLVFSKNITYIHDVYFKIKPEHIEPRNLTMLQRNISKFIKRASIIIGVSEHAKSEIEQYFPESKGKVDFVYNGVDVNTFYRRNHIEVSNIVEKYGLSSNGFFLFFSNIEPRKNVESLLAAYEIYCRRLRSESADLLLIGGMGWGNKDVLVRIENLKKQGLNIIRPDRYVPDEDMPALISGAKALVHPAVYEGFGLTPLEAMACGTPILIGNNSSLPEVVGDTYGEYIEVEKPESIATAMIGIDQYPEALVKKGIERSRLFSWENSASKLIKIIQSI